MATLKNTVIKEDKLIGTKANGRIEQRQISIDGKSTTVKIYSMRNAEFGAFEYIVPARAGIVVKPNQEVELVNPRLHSVGRVNSSQYTDSRGNRVTDYVGFVERSIIGDSVKLKGEK